MTIIRELVLSLPKVVLKHSVKYVVIYYMVRHKEHIHYIWTNNPTSAYALHILNNKHECGTAAETELLKPCHKGTCMNCWETFYMEAFHQHKILITEQQVSDINPFYEIADTSRIPLYAPWLSLILHNTQHTSHSKVSLHYTFTFPVTYLFALHVCISYSFIFFIADLFTLYNYIPYSSLCYIVLKSVPFYYRHAATPPHNI
jgi:hypothetical protein